MTLALEQLDRAAAKNHSGAINALGWYALEIKQNFTEAAQLFERSHWLGNKDAAHNLGHMWFYARNTDKVIDRVSINVMMRTFLAVICYFVNSLHHKAAVCKINE